MVRVTRFLFLTGVVAVLLGARDIAAGVLPLGIDGDGDGHIKAVETALGSDPNDAGSTPESFAIPETCFDGVDNDGDGAIDAQDPTGPTDPNSPGCDTSQATPARGTFPGPGRDVFASKMTLRGFQFDVGGGVICGIDFEGKGPTVITRGAPVSVGPGLQQIPVEITAMQITGSVRILAVPSTCPFAPSTVPATIFEDPNKASTGKVTDTNPAASDFPASTFFNVFFKVHLHGLFTLLGGPDGGPAGAAFRLGDPNDPNNPPNLITTLPPYHTPESPGHESPNPNCYNGTPKHEHCVLPPLNDFKCYAARSKRLTVELRDQFDDETVQFSPGPDPLTFCNPVSKNGGPIADPDSGHLTCYELLEPEPAFEPKEVTVKNQFGTRPLLVVEPFSLCLPTQKDPLLAPTGLDHFKCYKVEGAPIREDVTLEDQFDKEEGEVQETRVLDPLVLCNPVEKRIGFERTKIGNPEAHLVCYKIRPPHEFRRRDVLTRCQFGVQALELVQVHSLCVESLKLD